MLSIFHVSVFSVALVTTLILTPIIRNLALRRHFLDHPDDRKIHTMPIPLLGGIPVFIGVILASAAGAMWFNLEISSTLVGLTMGALILVILGIVDDRKGMRPLVKLSGQFAAAGVVIFCGCKVALIPNDLFAILLSFLWIVGLTNAMNLLDNMDGMTGGVALIASGAFFGLSFLNNLYVPAIISLALAGACLGYLRYNFPPASIFLGDTGSMLIGFLLAVLGLMVTNGPSSPVGLAIPLLVMAYPIFDTTLVTLTRLADGRKVSMGGKDHSTHRIRKLLNSDRQTTMTVYLINSILAGTALFLSIHLDTLSTLSILTMVMAILGYMGIRLSRVPVDVKRPQPIELESDLPPFVSRPASYPYLSKSKVSVGSEHPS